MLLILLKQSRNYFGFREQNRELTILYCICLHGLIIYIIIWEILINPDKNNIKPKQIYNSYYIFETKYVDDYEALKFDISATRLNLSRRGKILTKWHSIYSNKNIILTNIEIKPSPLSPLKSSVHKTVTSCMHI